MIDLISDTVTRPTASMLQAMMQAEVGDDVFGQDPTISALERRAAALFGHEASVFCPSGTMTNQIALAVHCGRLEEVICHEYSHIYQYEAGGYASNSGISIQLLPGENGKITAEQVRAAVRPDHDWLPHSRLVVIENTCNKAGGSIYTLQEMQSISEACRQMGVSFHLDGARIFNALVETGDSPSTVGQLFDSVSVCLSKGLGAPVGSVLIGSSNFIRMARRVRKAMGGGMRQAGYLAAAGIYALDNHVDRLSIDNHHAKVLGECLSNLPWVSSVRPVQSNIVIFDLTPPLRAADILKTLASSGLRASAFGPSTIRFVTHLDVSPSMISRATEILANLKID